jgi:hypothetical protein
MSNELKHQGDGAREIKENENGLLLCTFVYCFVLLCTVVLLFIGLSY